VVGLVEINTMEETMVEKEKKEEKFELVEVPTQYGLAIQTPEGKILSTEQAIVQILNDVKIIKDSVAD